MCPETNVQFSSLESLNFVGIFYVCRHDPCCIIPNGNGVSSYGRIECVTNSDFDVLMKRCNGNYILFDHFSTEKDCDKMLEIRNQRLIDIVLDEELEYVTSSYKYYDDNEDFEQGIVVTMSKYLSNYWKFPSDSRCKFRQVNPFKLVDTAGRWNKRAYSYHYLWFKEATRPSGYVLIPKARPIKLLNTEKYETPCQELVALLNVRRILYF